MPTPLWKCPQCARLFANRNQSHFCSSYTLREHLEGGTRIPQKALVAPNRRLKSYRRGSPAKRCTIETRITAPTVAAAKE